MELKPYQYRAMNSSALGFIDEFFPKGADGKARAFQVQVQIDTPSVLKIGVLGLILISVNYYINKK